MDIKNYIDSYLSQSAQIVQMLDKEKIAKVLELLIDLKKNGGRLFILGVGGSAANASHAVNDFRKIAGIEAYSSCDNFAELTARVNDDGWDSVFVEWLKGSRCGCKDCIFILSVGGGNAEKNISRNLVRALDHAKSVGAKTIGIVGRDGGYTARVADAAIIVPTVDDSTITPHAESFQAVVWHLLVTHPAIKGFEMKWESTVK